MVISLKCQGKMFLGLSIFWQEEFHKKSAESATITAITVQKSKRKEQLHLMNREKAVG